MSLAIGLLRTSVGAAALVALSSLVACGSSVQAPPGMTIVASSGNTSGPGSMLVAFPKSACTGSDNAVFLDEHGGFVSAVAPGTATYVAFPRDAARLFVVSSQDVTAEPGIWFRRHEIAAPGDRVEKGILLVVARYDAKHCFRRAMVHPELVTYEEATRAAVPLTWLDVDTAVGTQWVDAHRPRVVELLGRPPAENAGPGVTSLTNIP